MIQIGILIYCFLLFIRPADWVPEILGWPLEFIVLGLTTLLSGMRAFQLRGTDEAPPMSHHIKFLVLWILAILLSNLSKGNFDAAGSVTVEYAKKCIITLTFWFALTSLRQVRSVALAIVVLAAILGLQGIYQKNAGIGWAGQKLYWDDRICWVGLWDGANVLSLVFVMSLSFALEVLLGVWNWFWKLLSAAAIGLILTGLVLAASRGAWVAVAVIVFIYFQRRSGKVGLVAGAVVLAALLLVAPSRLSRDDERDRGSTQGRISMWAEGFEMVQYNPVFGIGKGQFLNYTNKLIAHNSFVQNMGETGTFGLFAWVGLIYVSFRSLGAVRAAADQIEDKRILTMNEAVSTSLIGYMAASMFITTDFDLLYVLFGLSGAMLTVTRRETGLPLWLDMGWQDIRNILYWIVGITAVLYIVTTLMSPN